MRSYRTISLSLLLVASGCSQTNPVSPDQGGGNSSNSGPANTANAEVGTAGEPATEGAPVGPLAAMAPPFKYTNASTPEAAAKCDFEERDPSERPKHFVPASRDSNIIFYQRPKGPLWSDIDSNRAIAELEENELIVAARYQMPDLWITPKAGGATLEAGEKKLTCY